MNKLNELIDVKTGMPDYKNGITLAKDSMFQATSNGLVIVGVNNAYGQDSYCFIDLYDETETLLFKLENRYFYTTGVVSNASVSLPVPAGYYVKVGWNGTPNVAVSKFFPYK